ncbi:MAG: DUF2269 family protein [Crocinitomicaceae bacterium]|nr:DUF2269 family protein [Crocinitomicaceae bacterium]MBK8926213.1 DUF2269 family protein [Crocinitomicaceae bacterium]
MEFLNLIRTIHVLSGAFWIGEIAVINFIIIPAAEKMNDQVRSEYFAKVFPAVFKMASILAVLALITGVALVYLVTGDDLSRLFAGRWGLSILVGGIMATVLAIFHFFIEHKLARKLGYIQEKDPNAMADFHIKLKIVPRLGMVVITVIFLLMINAARGIW